jgi:hypothetical protein
MDARASQLHKEQVRDGAVQAGLRVALLRKRRWHWFSAGGMHMPSLLAARRSLRPH